jgi:uncharacterized RmlC-like cupin family protein
MSSPSNVPEADVRILRQGQLDASLACGFGAQLLAEITHLPTGTTSGRAETVTVPPGGTVAECPAGTDATLIHVVAGQLRGLWGSGPEHTTTADPGDTLLLPAGIAFQAINDSPVEALQFILVRGN